MYRAYITRFVILLLMLSPLWLNAQQTNGNPFFKEKDFFQSDFEKQLFSTLEQSIPFPPLPFFFTFSGSNQEEKVLQMKLSLDEFCNTIHKKKHASETSYLRKIFVELHRKYLKKYQRYATFDRLLTDGSYDCLTGSALYALALTQLGFNYTIHETALHSYIKVKLSNKEVLLETTDPLNGFIAEESEIAESEEKYSRELTPDFNNPAGLTGYRGSSETVRYFHEVVGLNALAGLQYFNQAVIQFNIGDYRKAVRNLEKAYSLYPSKRIALLLLSAIQKVLESKSISKEDIRLYAGKTNYYTKGAERFFN